MRPADLETAWSACVAKNERALDLKAALEKAERERTDAERRYDELVSVKERREASEMASASLEERAAEIEAAVARARAEAEAATAAAARAAETRAASVRERAVPTGVDAREANRSGPSDYAAIAGMNWSTLKHMARSPKMFQYRLEHPEPPKAAYDFGRTFHCALLEPKVFLERFAVAPDCDGRTKAGKAELAAWRALNVGREAISQEGMDTILGMSEAVRAHKVAGPLIDGVLAEETITWTDAETGILCKARLDMLGRDFLADVKTTRDPAPRAFARDAAQHLYAGQLAFYYDGAVTSGRLPKYTKPPFIICPEKTEPYDVVVFRLHQNLALEPGRALYRSLLRRFLECEAAGWYPGISPELQILELPPWAAGNDIPSTTSDFDLLGV
ncbi:MAG: hypothetical protein A3D95_05835 [Betaproteobacteria bacterium RIFCSPHIGHO2_12_FULL_69_13]|nr:MAG: hypothetical protein A3D95_05835 [Betaproteobacteria bacterium RIFCSPHIGHO2_12_FULL_69_13]